MVAYAPLAVKAVWEGDAYDAGACGEMKGGISFWVAGGSAVVLWVVCGCCVGSGTGGCFGCYFHHAELLEFGVRCCEMDIEIHYMRRLKTIQD